MIYKNIVNLCKERGISIARLEQEVGLGNATIRGWASSSPTVEKLKLVADYFGVTIDELFREPQKEAPGPAEAGREVKRIADFYQR